MPKLKSQFHHLAGCVILSGAMLATHGCGRKTGEVNADIAVIPDAGFVLMADLEAMNEAPITKKMEEFSKDQRQNAGEQAQKIEELVTKLKNITGLEDEDFDRFVISVVTRNIDFDTDKFGDVADSLNGVMAVEVAKTVTLDQLEEAAVEVAEDDPDTELKTSREKYKDTEILILRENDADADESVAISTAGNDKVIMAGTMLGTKRALDRARSGEIESAADALEITNAKNAPQFAMRFDLTDEMRDKMQNGKTQNKQQPGNPLVVILEAFESLQEIKLYLTMNEQMDLLLNLALADEETAQRARGVLDNSVLGMLRMGLNMMVGGKPLTLLETLKTTADSKGNVKLSFSLSTSDLTTIQKASQEQQQQQMAPQGMPAQ